MSPKKPEPDLATALSRAMDETARRADVIRQKLERAVKNGRGCEFTYLEASTILLALKAWAAGEAK